MSLWKTIRDSFRKVRRNGHMDEYLIQLKCIGVNASEVGKGSPAAAYARPRVFGGQYGDSVGLIHVPGFPAPFVNVRERTMGRYAPYQYYTDYLVPDRRLTSKYRRLSVEAKYKRTMQGYGNTIEAYWSGNDLSTGLLNRLNGDHYLKKNALLLFDERRPFEITTEPRRKLWVIRGSADTPPVRELFDTHQAIAQHLLATAIN